MTGAFSAIPSVDKLLAHDSLKAALPLYGHTMVADAVRATLADERVLVRSGRMSRDVAELAKITIERLEFDALSSLRPVFNLTGTVLHTNLGRAQLSEAAIAAACDAMRHAVALEYDLEEGRRGERDDHLRALICELTGAEDATLVNNNAAAVLIALNTFGEGRGAVISRGELIEIGGAFRMPDIMEKAGTRLVEVGTTNRTHAGDYARALNEETGLVLKVHTSNYRIEGFTKTVGTAELATLAHNANVPLIEDLGSGTLIDLKAFGLNSEPTVQEVVKAGADLVTFSGDKLLGGPQAGFIVGKSHLIDEINRNPMKRSLRVDKMRLAALEATLRAYRNPQSLMNDIPVLRFLSRQVEDIAAVAAALRARVSACLGSGFNVEIATCDSEVGSGASPAQTLPSSGLAIAAVSPTSSLVTLQRQMRALPIPVIGRIKNDRLVLDFRTLEEPNHFLANLGGLQQ